MTRRGWSLKEDQAVKALVQKHGTKNWSAVAHELCHQFKFKERTGKQCRQRYHNHLDPKISKRSWTADEQQTLFKMHKVYGNKWTSIAQHLEGRTDNTIKNHFYSTIRRSLRRMSKLIGEKNSTRQMKYIKPSTLSKIFAINTKPSSDEEIQEQRRKCQENPAYLQLVNFINFQCQELTDVILQFSDVKPKGKNCTVPLNQRGRYGNVLEKMEKLNELYEKMRKQQRRINSTFKMSIEDSESSQSAQESNQSQQQLKITKVTRSKRQIKPPKKFEQQLNPGSSKSLTKRQKKAPILLKKNSVLLRELEERSHEISILDKMQIEKKQCEKCFELPDHEFDINFQVENEYFPSQIFMTQTPAMPFPTNLHNQTPASYLFQNNTSPLAISGNSRTSNLYNRMSNCWTLSNGELDDIVGSLGSQIAKNTSENREKDDGKTIVSNINCSPNSAFKSCQ